MRMILLISLFWLPVAHASFNFENLKTLLDQSKAGTVEEFLPFLPQEFKDNYVLVYESNSLQSASFERPRVIAFNGAESLMLQSPQQLIVAFQTNASEQSNRPNTLEIFEWQPETATYTPYEVIFLGQGKGYQLGSTQMCTHCHHSPARPNWTGYPFWPGVYGSGFYPVDMFTQLQEQKFHQLEAAEFKKLKANWANTPRLSQLNSMAMPEPIKHGASLSINNLTSQLGVQNRTRVARMLKDSQDYQKYKYAIAASFSPKACDIQKFFSQEEYLEMRKGVFEFNKKVKFATQYLPSLDAITFENVNKNTKVWLSRSVIFSDEMEARTLTWMRFIFEGRGQARYLQNMLGQVPIRDLTFSYDLTTVGARFHFGVQSEFEKLEPMLFKMSCDELAKKSLGR